MKEDLEAGRPMDRLVCGDVGFGKTEVAVRAAFAVALNDRQTLVLCPTTILAEQHWNTFRERYRDFPVRVEMVSRFRSRAEQTRILADFREGKVDVLIGTTGSSRATSSRRTSGSWSSTRSSGSGWRRRSCFGRCGSRWTCSRSRRRRFRGRCTCRFGLRDISIIETPPSGRRPVRTTVGEYDDELIRTALEREHARGGQAFYLHNRVESIDEARQKLEELCPGLRFLVAHGQMSEKELEERMHSFLAGDADVLVSTTIIESGIDIPQANTLVVERADALGLAQLYQIRGRVGRSDVLAYAYLFYPDSSELTAEARARLSTLADHTELGAASRSPCATSRSGARAISSAPSSRGMSPPSGSSSTWRCSTRRSPSSPAGAGSPRVRSKSTRAWTRTFRRRTSPRRRSRSISIAVSPSPRTRTSCASSSRPRRTATARCRNVENLFAIQEAKLKLARLGADYLVFRGGRVTVGPLALGSAEVRELWGGRDLVYSTQKRELSLRVESLEDRPRAARCSPGASGRLSRGLLGPAGPFS